MALKTLLVAFSTVRKDDDDKDQRVRFKAGSVVDLTDAELADLQKLQDATGKLHFRDPKSEGGLAVESKAEVVDVPDYAGQDVAMDDKTVDQLKAYLTFHDVSFKGNASKDDLLKAATDHAADPDAGL